MNSHRARPIALVVALAVTAMSCASFESVRYVQVRTAQATLNDRATDALEAGLIDVTTAKRILALSEAISEQATKYRVAVAEGKPRSTTHAILAVLDRLLQRADLFLPAPEIVK